MDNTLLPIVQYYNLRSSVNINGVFELLDNPARPSSDFLVCPRSGIDACDGIAHLHRTALVYESRHTRIYRLSEPQSLTHAART